MSSSLLRSRSLFSLVAVSALTAAACSLGGCSDSEPYTGTTNTNGGTGGTGGASGKGGTAGSTSGGSAGSTAGGSAGSTAGGSAGSTAGGSAGSTSGGAAGTAGKAGSAGSTSGGSAGSTSGGAAGTAGKAGSAGTAGSTAGGSAGSTAGGSAGSSAGGSAGSSAGGSAGSTAGGSDAGGAAGSDAGGAAGSDAGGAAGSDAGGSAGAGGSGLPAPSTYTLTGAGFTDATKHTGKKVRVKLQASSGEPIVGEATILAGGFAIPLVAAQNREYAVEGFIDSGIADNQCGAEEPILTPFTVTFDEALEGKTVAPADFNGGTCPIFPLVNYVDQHPDRAAKTRSGWRLAVVVAAAAPTR